MYLIRVPMNKRDRELTNSEEWGIMNNKIYEIINNVISNHHYDVKEVFYNASDKEIEQYLLNLGFPWNTNWV